MTLLWRLSVVQQHLQGARLLGLHRPPGGHHGDPVLGAQRCSPTFRLALRAALEQWRLNHF